MAKIAEFCGHPGDLEGCRRSLLQARNQGSLREHCILEGLRANWHQCRQVLLEGLYDKTSSHNSTKAVVDQKEDLKEACKQVILLGLPSKIEAIPEVFYEAYYRFVRYIVHRHGIKDDGLPSADDVSQQVFADLIAHFQKGASVEGHLGTYVASATVHECFRALKDAARGASLTQVHLQIETSVSAVLLPPAVIECWEDLDQRVVHSPHGNLINRIILAQRCLEACSTGQKLSAKQLMADWQRLSAMSEGYMASLHTKVIKETKRSPDRGVVAIAGDLVNTGAATPSQMAIVFAAGTGMDLEQTRHLLAQIKSLSSTAVYARICRIYAALQPAGAEEEL